MKGVLTEKGLRGEGYKKRIDGRKIEGKEGMGKNKRWNV